MIQSRADSKEQPAFLSFQALDGIMANLDSESFTYDSFKNVYDTVPGVKELVANFDAKGVTIKTSADAEKPTQGNTDTSGKGVSSAAKRAAKRGISKDLT